MPSWTAQSSDKVPLRRVDPEIALRAEAVVTVQKVLSKKMDQPADEVRRLAEAVVDESKKFGFDPLFVLAVIELESNYDPEAVSPTGARGLMQVIPGTWKRTAQAYGLDSKQLKKFDPVDNLKVGVRYLHLLGKDFKRPQTLLLAYNQGPGTASQVLKGAEATPEGASYGPRCMAIYQRLLKEHGYDGKQAKNLFRSPEKTLLAAKVAPPALIAMR